MRHPVIAALVITLLVVLVVPPLGLGQAEADAEWSVHKDEDVYYRYPQKWIVLRESDPTVITDPAQIEYDNAKVPKFLGEGVIAGRMLAEGETLQAATDKVIGWMQRRDSKLQGGSTHNDLEGRLIDGIPVLITPMWIEAYNHHEQENIVVLTLRRGDFVFYWRFFAPLSRAAVSDSQGDRVPNLAHMVAIEEIHGIFYSIRFALTVSSNLQPGELAKRALGSLVTVESRQKKRGYLGSGFVVAPELVVTNSHVAPASSETVAIAFTSSRDKEYVVWTIARDDENDLLLLRVPGLPIRALELSPRDPTIGESVFVAGNPEGLEGTFSAGNVAGIRTFGNRKLIQITAPISHGSSGGPVLDGRGLVIGVTVSFLKEGQNLNFAVPGSAVIALLQRQ